MPSTIRPQDVTRFTQGDCHIFARRLEIVSGWPLYTFVEDDYPDLHAWNMHPSGRAVDITGIHDLEEFCNHWGCSAYERYRFEDLGAWGDCMFGSYSYTRARVLVPVLIERIANA